MSKVLSAFVTGFIALLAITCIINLFFGEAWVAVLCGAEAGILLASD